MASGGIKRPKKSAKKVEAGAALVKHVPKAAAPVTVTKHRRHRNKPIVLRARHSRAYRKRQITSLMIAVFILIALALQTGIMIGRTQPGAPPVSDTPRVTGSSVSVVRSSYGYSFTVDANAFDVSATMLDASGAAKAAPQEQLRTGQALSLATAKPKDGTIPRIQAASQFSVQVNPSPAAYTLARQNPVNSSLSAAQVAAQLFPVTSTSELDVSVLSSTPSTLSTVPVQKTVYQYTPKFNGGTSYAVVWTGVSQGRAFAVKMQGLVGSSNIPAAFNSIFDSLTISGDQSVQGANIDLSKLLFPKASAADVASVDSRYLSDAYSPAVVKIYNITCGTLVFFDQNLGGGGCDGSSGSGFIMTSDGYIATNGHVVSYTAQDALVKLLLSDDTVLASFLAQVAGMNDAQVNQVLSDPAVLASVIAKVYDIPDANLNIADEQQVIMVAIGDDAPDLTTITKDLDLTKFSTESSSLKLAKVVGVNYQAKDLYESVADPTKGFSSSDVAIIKVNLHNAPTISLATTAARQDQKIIVAGFPGDADNNLTDNTKLSISVTNGSISSIRKAAGGKGNLYQSDVDASHGNSGGPAIDEDGNVIGLLTYRLGDGSDGNAAKSYIRDIADVQALASSKGIKINAESTTRTSWEKGLNAYATNHYSKALKDFDQVKAAYPSQRLVSSYIASSQKAIAAGKDVKDFPIAVLMVGVVVAIIAIGVAVFVIVRQHGHHKVYQAYQPAMPGGAPGPNGYVVHNYGAPQPPQPQQAVQPQYAPPAQPQSQPQSSVQPPVYAQPPQPPAPAQPVYPAQQVPVVITPSQPGPTPQA
ncbi:MAG: Peptidase [Candidatus Saccharibacteria bacterium]|nr:Peptidase [Candidatus Saccharibacteria bacterium]